MIREKQLPDQTEFWVERSAIVAVKGSTFYDQLGEDLESEGFGPAVRELCAPYYSEKSVGRPPIDPEVYFKMLMVGFFEGIGSERGIASRCEDSMSIRRFLRYDLTEVTPDHSTLSTIRSRLPLEVFAEVFALSLKPLRAAELITGEEVGIDSSIFEANASLEKLVRREDGQSYKDYIRELAAEAGIDPEDTEAVIKFDRNRENKRVSNDEWYSPNDPEAKIGPKKDGAWDMIHKVENVTDQKSGALLSIEVQPADKADSEGMADHIEKAINMIEYADEQIAEDPAFQERLHEKANNDQQISPSPEKPSEEKPESKPLVTGDKGYHKNEEIAQLDEIGVSPCIAIPDGKKPPKQKEQAQACQTNRENRESDKGKEALKNRSEKTERSFMHILNHGGARRTTLCGHDKIAKRMFISGFTFNRSIYSWNVHGYGTVKQLAAGNRNPFSPISLFRLVYKALKRVLRGLKSVQPISARKLGLGKANYGCYIIAEKYMPSYRKQ